MTPDERQSLIERVEHHFLINAPGPTPYAWITELVDGIIVPLLEQAHKDGCTCDTHKPPLVGCQHAE